LRPEGEPGGLTACASSIAICIRQVLVPFTIGLLNLHLPPHYPRAHAEAENFIAKGVPTPIVCT
jgi:hypothetical protein